MRIGSTPIGFLTEEQAAPIRERWLRRAGVEFVFWCVFATLAYAFFRDFLAGLGWTPLAYAELVIFSLMVFNRVALWLVILSLLTVGWFWGNDPVTGDALLGIFWAVGIRATVKFFTFLQSLPGRGASRHASLR